MNRTVYHYALGLTAACGRINAVRLTDKRTQVTCTRCRAGGWGK